MGNPQQDTWVDVKSQPQSQDEWKDVSHGNVNVPSGVVATPNPGSHPTFSPQQENIPASFVKGLYQGGVGLSNEVNAIKNRIVGTDTTGMTPAQIDEINKPPVPNPMFNGIRNIPDAQPGTLSGLAQNAGQGITGSAPIAGMSPFIGMPGAFAANKGLEDYSQNKGALKTATDMGGAALTGKALELASGLGSTATNALRKVIPNQLSENIANRVGSTLGGGVAGAVSSGGNPVAIAQGAALSAIAPSKPTSMSSLNPISGIKQGMNNLFPPNPQDLIEKEGAPLYAKAINAPSTVINGLDIKNNKDIDNSYKLAASMGLILKTSIDGKTQDNESAIPEVKQAAKPIYNKLDQIYNQNQATHPSQGGFDLNDIKTQVNKLIDTPTLPNGNNNPNYIKLGGDASVMKSKVNDLIQAEIDRPSVGQYVNAQKVNSLRQGFNGKGWTSFSPVEQQIEGQASRRIASVMKDQLENHFPTDDVKGLNAKAGEYLTLQSILEKQHGKPVATNSVKPMTIPIVHGASRAIGAGIGALAGHIMPGAEGAGPWAGLTIGGEIGNKISEGIKARANSRENLTTAWANKLNAAKMVQSQNNGGQSVRPGVVIPHVMGTPPPRTVPQGISMNSMTGNIGYDPVEAQMRLRRQQVQNSPVNTPLGTKDAFGNQYGQKRAFYTMDNNILPGAIRNEGLRGPSASSMNPINIPPKVMAANGPLQPNLRAQVDMSKGGMAQNAGAPIQQQPIQQRIPQGGSQSAMHNMSNEELEMINKKAKIIKKQVELEKIIRS